MYFVEHYFVSQNLCLVPQMSYLEQGKYQETLPELQHPRLAVGADPHAAKDILSLCIEKTPTIPQHTTEGLTGAHTR